MKNLNNFDIAILLIRIAIGVIFVAHGSQKLFGAFGGGGIAGLTEMIRGLSFGPPSFWAWIVALSEFFGGVFILAGVFPRVSAALISIIMIVAIFKVHGGNGFFASNRGIEYQFLILMSSLAIILAGAGRFSIFNKF